MSDKGCISLICNQSSFFIAEHIEGKKNNGPFNFDLSFIDSFYVQSILPDQVPVSPLAAFNVTVPAPHCPVRVNDVEMKRKE